MKKVKRSPWVIHYDGSSCNGCDIELIACLTPVYDLERLGVVNTGNPKHADVFLVTGSVNEENKSIVQTIYQQMPGPKVVVAVGACAILGGIFAECYNVYGGVDRVIPVDVYVPGCAARPEAIIDGILKAVDILEQKNDKLREMAGSAEGMVIEKAELADAPEILALQKLAYRSEAEIYNDFSIPPLTQTIDELQEDFRNKTFLKAVFHGRIAGSGRAYLKEGTCYAERLIVDPLYQHHGIGGKLMDAMEDYFPGTERCQISTGEKSRQNIIFYQRRGYRVFKKEKGPEGMTKVLMEKKLKTGRESNEREAGVS